MVSDPDKQTDSLEMAPVTTVPEATSSFAGFSSAAAAPTAGAASAVETEDSKSWARQFANQCDQLWGKMKDRFQKKSIATTDPQPDDIYKKLWFRTSLGHQVFDCGDCVHMSGTKHNPVNEKQIQKMVLAAINRKDPPWETIYMWDHKGRPDPAMGVHVQNVINKMREQGMIPADCRIKCSTEYPCAHLKDFNKYLRSLFAQAANPLGQTAPGARAGLHAHERAGLHGAAPA